MSTNSGTFKKGMIPWNKGKNLHYSVWNKGLTGLPPRHVEQHSYETKQKCSEATRLRWKRGKYVNRVIDYASIAEKAKKRPKKGKNIVCLTCSKSFYSCPSYLSKGRKFCSNQCQGEYFTGTRNWKWRDGIKRYPYKHCKNKKYKNWRTSVFQRDNYICRTCGLKSQSGKVVILHPHHIKSYTHFPDLRYELENGLTLCIECHKNVHRKRGQ